LGWLESQLILVNGISTAIVVEVDVVADAKTLLLEEGVQLGSNLPAKPSFPHTASCGQERKGATLCETNRGEGAVQSRARRGTERPHHSPPSLPLVGGCLVVSLSFLTTRYIQPPF